MADINREDGLWKGKGILTIHLRKDEIKNKRKENEGRILPTGMKVRQPERLPTNTMVPVFFALIWGKKLFVTLIGP